MAFYRKISQISFSECLYKKHYIIIILIGLFAVLFINPTTCSSSPGYSNIERFASNYRTISDSILIRKILLKGNKLTKDKIIIRELLFKENETVCVSKLGDLIEQSRKNLLNTSLFNFVSIDTSLVSSSNNEIDIIIDFTERWYIWPIPILHFADRNFNAWLDKKDWTRLNYGMYITVNNFRGRKEKLIFYTQFGYDENYNLLYQIPYIDKKQQLGLSFSGGFLQNHEIQFMTKDNKPSFYKADNRPMKNIFSYAELTYRKGIYNSHKVRIQFNYFHFSDSLLQLNNDFAFNNQEINKFLSFDYQFKIDHRDFKSYPLTGYYFDFEILKKGLGIVQKPEINSLIISANLRKYFKINNKTYFASGLTVKTTPSEHEPYYFQKGLGYHRDFIRGYEYYVVDGGHYGLLKTNLKYELIPSQTKILPFLKSEKFNKVHYAGYISTFLDVGYAKDDYFNDYNSFSNKLLLGGGVGFDFVTYYDVVIRVEYSMNHLYKKGLFIHFMASI